MNLLARVLVNGLALWLASKLFPGVHWQGGIFSLLVAGLVLGLLNTLVRPVLVVLSLPLLVVTLGLFYFVLNGLIVYFADWLLDSFRVDSFAWALATGLWLTFFNLVLKWLAPQR
jgi:putative membrane protein